MGFCRRCGDIVAGARCRCGGTAVAPVIAWNHGNKETEQPQDRWSKTYVSPKKSPSFVQSSVSTSSSTTGSFTSNSASTSSSSTNIPTSVTTRKFPRPKSTPSISSRPLSRGINEHILATTSQSPRPPSPLKFSTTFSDPTSDILPSLSSNEPSLSKVYGSVLQPKETLPLHSCALCSAIFLPDATIYPNPSEVFDGKTFVCRQCYTTNGGSKGNCPSCSRPVLALKAEGGFIQSGGKYWHKGCFTCVGCFKNIGSTPMVDLFGRPTCAECFDNCLKRDHPVTPKKGRISNNNSPSLASPGGLSSSYGRKSREGSPMIDELEQRLGIVKSRESSPAVVDLGRSAHDSPTRSVSTQLELSNTRRYSKMDDQSPSKSTNSPRLTSYTSTTTNAADSPLRRSFSELQQSQIKSIASSPRLSTPERADLRQADGSNDMTVSDLGEIPRASLKDPSAAKISRASISSPATVKTGSVCNKCQKPILNSRQGGHFVTIPGLDENDSPKLYHSDCFKCTVCDKTVGEAKKGQASFVLASVGPCHVQCAPLEHYVIRKMPIVKPLEISARDILDPPMTVSPTKNSTEPLSSRYERPLSTIQPKAAMPRFGGQSACPGCQKAVSLMERGVVPGPQGTRWHASCLVCGGRKDLTAARLLGREDKKKGQPGCGKRLDSAAKSDGEGGIWCRECLLLTGIGGSPQTSPTRSSPILSSAETTNKITPHFTGTTTIARQFTGMGGGESIFRQLTGGGLSPTRSISPTKQLGTARSGIRPRPKSVIGMRSAISIDEGRGMFLIKQMTGQTHGSVV